ncbi:DUF2264 domain-containing protein [Mangrovibacter sp. SLW1]
MAAFGFLLAVLPEKGWQPLPATTQEQLATWLAGIQCHTMPQNNWLFFTLLVQAGLTRVGREDLVDQALRSRYLEKIASWYRAEGWYGDGDDQAIDHYGGFAMHFYGLIYSCLLANPDKEYAQLFTRHARDFITPSPPGLLTAVKPCQLAAQAATVLPVPVFGGGRHAAFRTRRDGTGKRPVGSPYS